MVRSGKRLRPLVCLLCYDAVRGADFADRPSSWQAAISAAAAIELVHNFSLIHDDIEDNSDERHGRPTVWKIWGISQGINAGDAVFVLARLALDRLARLVDLKTYADVQLTFDRAALALTQGQFLDLCFESRDRVTVEEYVEMVQGKTAALLAASAQIGARLATDDEHTPETLGRYGENLGIAFQIADDILGIWGDPAITGKPARDDIVAKKKTLPLLAAVQQDSSGEIASYFRKKEVNSKDAERITVLLENLNVREWAGQIALGYVSRALAAIEDSGLSGLAVNRLKEIAEVSVNRLK